MEPIFARVLDAKRKRFFGSKPVFKPHKPVADIADIEARIGVALPPALKRWLVAVKGGMLQEGAAPGVGLRRR